MNPETTLSIVISMLTSSRPSGLVATSLLISDKKGAMYEEQEILSELTVSSGLSFPRVPPTQPPPRPLHHETEESKGNAAHATTHMESDTTTEAIVLDPNDVGIPNETKWDVNGGYPTHRWKWPPISVPRLCVLGAVFFFLM